MSENVNIDNKVLNDKKSKITIITSKSEIIRPEGLCSLISLNDGSKGEAEKKDPEQRKKPGTDTALPHSVVKISNRSVNKSDYTKYKSGVAKQNIRKELELKMKQLFSKIKTRIATEDQKLKSDRGVSSLGQMSRPKPLKINMAAYSIMNNYPTGNSGGKKTFNFSNEQPSIVRQNVNPNETGIQQNISNMEMADSRTKPCTQIQHGLMSNRDRRPSESMQGSNNAQVMGSLINEGMEGNSNIDQMRGSMTNEGMDGQGYMMNEFMLQRQATQPHYSSNQGHVEAQRFEDQRGGMGNGNVNGIQMNPEMLRQEQINMEEKMHNLSEHFSQALGERVPIRIYRNEYIAIYKNQNFTIEEMSRYIQQRGQETMQESNEYYSNQGQVQGGHLQGHQLERGGQQRYLNEINQSNYPYQNQNLQGTYDRTQHIPQSKSEELALYINMI